MMVKSRRICPCFGSAKFPIAPSKGGRFRTSPQSRALLILTLFLVVLAAVAPATVVGQPASAESASLASSQQILHYTLPPDKLQKAYALYLLNFTLYFVTVAWSLIVLYLMLRTRFGAWLRNLAERISRFRVVQAAVVMSLFVLVLQLTQLPFDGYQHHVSLQYG